MTIYGGGWRMEWMSWLNQHTALLVWLAGISIVTLGLSAVALPWLIVKIPEDYFADGKNHALPWANRHPLVRAFLILVKNLLGVVLVLAGVAMLVLPGRIVVTMAAGVGLVDFPGRHRLLRRFVCKHPVLKSLNWIRTRAGRPPLVLTANASLAAN